MTKSEPVKVTIGDNEYTIQRFRGLKAIMVMASVTRLTREVPDILANAVKDYQSRNTVTVTEEMSHLPRWSGFTKEDFDAAEARTNKRTIELPSPMTQNEQIMQALPKLLTKARKEMTRLLAILLIPNEQLREADKTDKVEEALDEYEDMLLNDAELDELAELVFAAQDVLGEQLGDKREKMGKLWATMRTMWSKPSEPQTNGKTSPPTTDATSTKPTSLDDRQTSFTGLQSPIDGVESKPSLTPLGVS